MKLILLSLFIHLVTSSWCLSQQVLKSVAVLDFKGSGTMEAYEVKTLTNRFRGQLVQTRAFAVVERDKMEEILKEQDFILSDACITSECAVEVGQLLGVEMMIAGDIGKVGQVWTVDLRAIDVSSGEIIETESDDHEGNIEGLLSRMQAIARAFAKMNHELSAEPQNRNTNKPGVIGQLADLGLTVGFDLGVVQPLGGFLDDYTATGLGLRANAGYLLNNRVTLHVSYALQRFGEKRQSSENKSQINLGQAVLGARYMLTDIFFAAGGAGLYFANNQTDLGFSPGVGMVVPTGYLDSKWIVGVNLHLQPELRYYRLATGLQF